MKANTVAAIPELLQIINEFSCLDIKVKKNGEFFKYIYFSKSICGYGQRRRLTDDGWRTILYRQHIFPFSVAIVDYIPWILANTKREYLYEYYSIPMMCCTLKVLQKQPATNCVHQ